ncbi:bifunctional tetrahydrofolate synthase/dihydrofolate synthase [Thalassotalea euphylliae]|uniref:bifunctional tetrahydrofolate synthase/dihydrofolate synthase n=1 Tax=Thalassotalea euphylliae TaxID=1655234 RepID=UPI0036321629
MTTAFDKSHCDNWSLSQWLCYLETIHTKEIDLGLARISQVSNRLGINLKNSKVITVAGTNGKGTTCAFLENYLRQIGHSVAVYSSPHIEKFNERLRLDGVDVEDVSWVEALRKIEIVREEISLTYYEFTTLAALLILQRITPDFVILEVGLGGRLDATNIIDADCSVLTTVDLDHQAFLGNDRETIGFEKAGIFRAGKPAIIGDVCPPNSVIRFATEIKANCIVRNKSFSVEHGDSGWSWTCGDTTLDTLPWPHIPLDNVATALASLLSLNVNLERELTQKVIEKTKVAGRTELFNDNCEVMLDVGHNPQAARYLAEVVSSRRYSAVHAVLGMMKDKDISSTINIMKDVVDSWYFATLTGDRAAKSLDISELAQDMSISGNCFDNVVEAYTMAQKNARSDELVLVFGSFFTVAEIRPMLLERT